MEGTKDLCVPSKLLRKIKDTRREIDENKKCPTSKIGVAETEVEKPWTSVSVSELCNPSSTTAAYKRLNQKVGAGIVGMSVKQMHAHPVYWMYSICVMLLVTAVVVFLTSAKSPGPWLPRGPTL